MIYFPRILLSAGEAFNATTKEKPEVDWSTVRSEDDRILNNGWYVKPDRPTPEPGELYINPNMN